MEGEGRGEHDPVAPAFHQHAEQHHRHPEPGQPEAGDDAQLGLGEAELRPPVPEDRPCAENPIPIAIIARKLARNRRRPRIVVSGCNMVVFRRSFRNGAADDRAARSRIRSPKGDDGGDPTIGVGTVATTRWGRRFLFSTVADRKPITAPAPTVARHPDRGDGRATAWGCEEFFPRRWQSTASSGPMGHRVAVAVFALLLAGSSRAGYPVDNVSVLGNSSRVRGRMPQRSRTGSGRPAHAHAHAGGGLDPPTSCHQRKRGLAMRRRRFLQTARRGRVRVPRRAPPRPREGIHAPEREAEHRRASASAARAAA